MLGNWLKTSILMAGIVALFGVVGMALGGSGGMLIALVMAGVMNIYAYWFSDKAVLRMYDAHQIPMNTAEQHPETAQMMIINLLSAEASGACSARTRKPKNALRD